MIGIGGELDVFGIFLCLNFGGFRGFLGIFIIWIMCWLVLELYVVDCWEGVYFINEGVEDWDGIFFGCVVFNFFLMIFFKVVFVFFVVVLVFFFEGFFVFILVGIFGIRLWCCENIVFFVFLVCLMMVLKVIFFLVLILMGMILLLVFLVFLFIFNGYCVIWILGNVFLFLKCFFFCGMKFFFWLYGGGVKCVMVCGFFIFKCVLNYGLDFVL